MSERPGRRHAAALLRGILVVVASLPLASLHGFEQDGSIGKRPAVDDPAATRPNIVVILADDMGYADIGVHGCDDIPTPAIDRIAREGCRFTAAYANGSFCTPTRAALMSGRYQHRCGIEDLGGPLPAAVKTLPDRLRQAGYTTAMVGKWHLGEVAGFTPTERGFDEFFGFLGGGHRYVLSGRLDGKGYDEPILRNREPVAETGYLTETFGNEAAAFVHRQKGESKPFFLYLAFNAVHTPLEVPPSGDERFAAIADRKRRSYAAMLAAMDESIGRVLDAIDQTGKTRDTVVVFTNDNGGPTTRNAVNGSRNTPLRGSKCETFEGGIRVPLLARWPGVTAPGTTYASPVMSFDITATALGAAQAEMAELDGVDLRPFLTGQVAATPHEALFWRSRTMSGNHAARVGGWKFVHSTEGDARPGPHQTPGRDMLFHVSDDVAETNDLAAARPDKLAEIKRLYAAWSDDVDADCRALGLEPKFPPRPLRP